MTAFDTLDYEARDRIAWLTLSRPTVLNALNLQMRDDLWAALDAAEANPEIAVLIFKGAGSSFSAGADITEFGTAPSIEAARQARLQRDLWGRLATFDKPLIAAVHGYALGAGCELTLLCDFRLASEDARFGLPEVNLGYIPTAGGTQTLPRTIPPGLALDMLLTAQPIDASTALERGLVHWVGPIDSLYTEAEAYARRLLAQPPEALRLARRALRETADLPLPQALALEARLRAQLP
ncbi:MAG TPA: enoyl-CoA hydratase/isomerase family protein [Dehalococcoidia bacterium]|nr:enoyl-CoA hydratase/isomerase family protein [Dehalococcoidia bacterium]